MVKWQYIIWTVALLALNVVCEEEDEGDDDDEPFVVTPLLEKGKCEEAQKEALVTPDFGGVKSYTGFFNVDKKCGDHFFFWFFQAQQDWENAPVLLWLNSYSRKSVLLEIFLDAGPFSYTKEKGFQKREYAWTKDHNVLFLDHPVGNGFSFTEKDCYPDSLDKIYSGVLAAVQQFFQLFPNLNQNPFFIVGQNVAGKYAPGITMEIDKYNKVCNATAKINLVGLLVGDPYLDLRCHPSAEYEYQLGILDKKNKEIAAAYDKKVSAAIDAKDYKGAADLIDKYPDVGGYLPSVQNILYDSFIEEDFQTYVRSFKIRPQLHVGHTPFHIVSNVLQKSLLPTIYEPVNSLLEEVLKTNKYIVGLYGGQLDLFNPYTAIGCVLEGLKWPGLKDYQMADRSSWYIDNRLAGWVKTAGNLWEVVIRDSGMYTTRDQPRATYTLIKAAVEDSPGKKLLTNLRYAKEDE